MRIIESMPAYTCSASGDGRFTHVSAGTLAYLGQRVDRPRLFHPMDSAVWRRALHPDDYERVLDRRRQSLRTGVHYDAEYRLRRWEVGRASCRERVCRKVYIAGGASPYKKKQ